MKWPWTQEQKTSNRKIERKSFALGLSDSLGAFLMLGSGGSASTATSALQLYRQSTAVATPVDMIADPFSCIGIALQIGDELVLEHDVLEFLKQPSPLYDQELFLNVLAKDFLITGECHIVAAGSINRPPLRLQPISPSVMSAVPSQNSDAPRSWMVSGMTMPGSYEADPNGLVVRYIDGPVKELRVIRNYSTRNNSLLRGMSILVAASREVRSHILGTEHNVQILESGGRVSLVFHFEEDMDDDDYDATVATIQEKYGGATNAGTIGVTAGGKMSIQELGVSPKDMDFAKLQNLVMKTLGLRYKVPLPLISDERQTLNNYETGNLALYDQAVLPLAKKILGGLSNLLLPRYGLDPKMAQLVVNRDTVTALVERRNEELKLRREMNLETINELRASIGREEIEGGNELYQAATLVPIGTDLFRDDNDPEIVESVLGGASNKPDTDGTEADDDEDDVIEDEIEE